MFLGAIIRWIPILVFLAINTVIIRFIVEEYPEAMQHKVYRYSNPEPPKRVVRLTGPNMTNIDIQMSSLSLKGRLTCIDYRTFNLADLMTNVTADDHGGSQYPSNQTHSVDAVNKFDPKKSLTAGDIQDVDKFVFFVGYPRSGHSIVGTMMDAHPNMIIAHEYNLFWQWGKNPHKHSQKSYLYNALYRNSVEATLSGWRSQGMVQKGYTLGLDYRWQGRFKRLKVIGDKSGAITTKLFENSPERFVESLNQLRRIIQVPIFVIHVVRSPYDMISTRLLYADGGKKTKLPATQERKHCNDYGLSYHTNRTFHLVKSVHELIERTKLAVLDVHHVDLVRNPRDTLSMICRFLNLPCPEDYLDACVKKTYAKPSKTRLLVSWPQKIVDEVYQLSKPYRFLWRYSFSGD